MQPLPSSKLLRVVQVLSGRDNRGSRYPLVGSRRVRNGGEKIGRRRRANMCFAVLESAPYAVTVEAVPVIRAPVIELIHYVE